MAQAGQGRGPEFRDKIMTIYTYISIYAKLTNECGLSQGAVTKFIYSPCISFLPQEQKETERKSVACAVNDNGRL